jgi:steroid delta-isomerase-like uncharacterized protein
MPPIRQCLAGALLVCAASTMRPAAISAQRRADVPAVQRTNKEVVRRYVEELWNGQRVELVDQVLTPDVVAHAGDGSLEHGNQRFRQVIPMVRQAFPDLHITIEALVAEGDQVAARLRMRGTHKGRLFGIEPAGRPLDLPEWFFFRLADGKIAEYWYLRDYVELRRQLQPQ